MQICFEAAPTAIEDYKPPEEESDKAEGQQIGEFKYRKPTRGATESEGLPMITRVYGLLVGKWDYTESNVENLPDVKTNMKQGEQYMTLLGVQPDDMVVLTDPTPQELHQKIKQLKELI